MKAFKIHLHKYPTPFHVFFIIQKVPLESVHLLTCFDPRTCFAEHEETNHRCRHVYPKDIARYSLVPSRGQGGDLSCYLKMFSIQVPERSWFSGIMRTLHEEGTLVEHMIPHMEFVIPCEGRAEGMDIHN